MNVGRYTIRVEHRPRMRRLRLVGGAAAALLAMAIVAVPAGAASNGSAIGTVTVAVRSVSVSPDAFSYDNCTSNGTPVVGLVVPHGVCSTAPQALTLTLGAVPSHLQVAATSFTPSDGGNAWGLCSTGVYGPSPGICSVQLAPVTYAPGTDEAVLDVFEYDSGTQTQDLEICNCVPFFSWDPTAGLLPGGFTDSASAQVTGPATSTDPSVTFSNTITWIATP